MGDAPGGEPQMPVNEDPPFIMQNLYTPAVVFLSQYGWYCVFGLIVLAFLLSKIQPTISQWLKKREEEEQLAFYKKNPDLAFQRQEAMERARRKLQEQHDSAAQIHAEKQKQLEEEKRQRKIEDWENHLQGKSYKSKVYKPSEEAKSSTSQSKPKKDGGKKPFRRSDYNPLMGDFSGGSSFRPARRGGASGGG